jgi:hypothetical protein
MLCDTIYRIRNQTIAWKRKFYYYYLSSLLQ